MRRLAVLTVAVLASCGGDGAVGDASHDGPELDAQDFPPAPTLGAPIDRMGRPVINTMLNSLFEPNATKKAAKRDAYNHAVEPAGWPTATLDPTAVPATRILGELSAYLGIFDSVDTGLTAGGCGNLPRYATPASNVSYAELAGILADDQLYVDTTRSQCDRYLAVEFSAALTVQYSSCGGRTLTHDVIDTSYSLLFAGASGFDITIAPLIHDGVGMHADVNNLMFPFLGAPH